MAIYLPKVHFVDSASHTQLKGQEWQTEVYVYCQIIKLCNSQSDVAVVKRCVVNDAAGNFNVEHQRPLNSLDVHVNFLTWKILHYIHICIMSQLYYFQRPKMRYRSKSTRYIRCEVHWDFMASKDKSNDLCKSYQVR